MLRISAIFIAVCMVLIAGSLGVVLYLRFGLHRRRVGPGGARRAHRACGLQRRCRPHARPRGGERSDRRRSRAARAIWRASSRSSAAGSVPWRPRPKRSSTRRWRRRSRSPPRSRNFRRWSSSSPIQLRRTTSRSAAGAQGSRCAGRRVSRTSASAGRWRSGVRAGRADRAHNCRLQRARPGRHHRRDPQRHRGPQDRSLPAAHRDAAAAQGALLRSDVAAQGRATASIVAAGDFLNYAEAGSLMPKLDNLSVLRCVQVVRRLCSRTATSACSAIFPERR